jgi:chloramphenicol 3-O-phosphotransferase
MTKIILITGCPGSGKSTIGRLLAETFASCIHLQVDAIRESIVSGFALPAPVNEWSFEETHQFKLARKVAIVWANTYAHEGINVVIDDVCIPEGFIQDYAELNKQSNVDKVLLNPKHDVLTERIIQRGGPYAEFFVENIAYVQGLIDSMPKEGWVIIDSSSLNSEQTTQAIVEQLDLEGQRLKQ